MDRLETRELAYFVAVAEELHFGRAARRLGIAQPPLSRAVKQLERRMGVVLLERGSQGVALTSAGEVLLAEGRRALESVAAATRRAQRAGQSERRLSLAVKPAGDGELLAGILAAYEADPAAVGVDVVTSAAGEQARMLRDGRADVALLHRTYSDLSGLDAEELLTERQVLVVAKGHRLAGRARVRLADLERESLPRWPGMPAPGGSGPVAENAGQLMQLVGLGRMVAVLPESALGYLHRDLVCVPVEDALPITLLVAWPEQSRSLTVAAFVRAAASVAARRRGSHAAG